MPPISTASSALGVIAGVGGPFIAVLATVLTVVLLELEHLPGGHYINARRARRLAATQGSAGDDQSTT